MVDEAVHQLNLSRLSAAIEKSASFWRSFTRSLSGSSMGRQTGEALIGAGAGALTAGVGSLGEKGVGFIREKLEKPRAFKAMIKANPGLSKKDSKATQMTFNTLYSFNREMANDPLVAASFVSRHVDRAEGAGMAGAYIDPATIKQLTDIGGRRRQPVSEAWQAAATKERAEKPKPDLGGQAKMELYKAQLQRKAQGKRPLTSWPKSPF
jgi:hypothetical protein